MKTEPWVWALGVERVPDDLKFVMGFRCDRCEAEVWLGAGIRVTDLTALSEAFTKKHNRCRER